MNALAATAALAIAFVGGVQILGGGPGDPCRDSYDCRGFLVGGAECLALEAADGAIVEAYCTRYCDDDLGCPKGWTCEDANPTVLAVRTTAVDQVCRRPR